MFFFFFSSRRRHTRWTGDWSTDVCSSDLVGMLRIPDHPDPRDRRSRFLEQLDPFPGELGLNEGHAGDIAARTSKTTDQPAHHGVNADRHDDRYRGGRALRIGGYVPTQGKDQIGSSTDQLHSELRQALGMTVREAVVEGHVPAFDVPQFSEAPAKLLDL